MKKIKKYEELRKEKRKEPTIKEAFKFIITIAKQEYSVVGDKYKAAAILAGLGVVALSGGLLGGVDKDVGDDNMSKITYCTYNINETLETASKTQQYLEEIIKECNGSTKIDIGKNNYTLGELENTSDTLKSKIRDLEQANKNFIEYLREKGIYKGYNEGKLGDKDIDFFDRYILYCNNTDRILEDITTINKKFGPKNVFPSCIKDNNNTLPTIPNGDTPPNITFTNI